MKKKASMGVMIAVVLLIVILIVYLMNAKQQNLRNVITRTESGIRDYTQNYMSVSSTALPYITYNGIPLEELLGVYACYGNESADYGEGLNFDVNEILRAIFNEIYGEDNWAVLIYRENSVDLPELPFIVDSSGSMRDDIEIISQIRDIISSESDIISLGEFDPEVTECKYGGMQPEENWAGACAFLCENGRPVKEGSSWTYEPWTSDRPKVIFVSSDEHCCGSENANAYDDTHEYVDEAIEKCNANGITIYYLMPRTYMLDLEQAEQLATETGGKIIDLDNAIDAVNEIIAELGLSDEKVFQKQVRTSLSIGNENLPTDIDLFEYTIIFPCPCTQYAVCKAKVFYSPQGGLS